MSPLPLALFVLGGDYDLCCTIQNMADHGSHFLFLICLYDVIALAVAGYSGGLYVCGTQRVEWKICLID